MDSGTPVDAEPISGHAVTSKCVMSVMVWLHLAGPI